MTVSEALSSPEAPFWKEAINSEIESVMQNHTWELVGLPSGSKPLGCKWILKRKYKADGSIDKYKARLVAKGFKQKEGLDFFYTYLQITRITSIRVLIVVVVLYDLEIHQIDVKTAFCNGELDEEIYMEQPEGFVVPGQEKKVCRLVKSLYGLKQSHKQWHEKFDRTMLSNGFKINECDKCVYVKSTQHSFIIVYLYVDDMLIMGSNHDIILTTNKMLTKHFDTKDMGLADVILGIKISKTSDGLALSQSHYVETILRKFKAYDSPPAKTPVFKSTLNKEKR
ncbi:UNVERIFIED_CONTAM: Retrovirus-related Pol polyprotein from transposon TNT 1-94 [Sesamum angustifolium]|uniref:Retrovirus-related Pol polyprotein from transposon TNT 1-94 n=1 Tax=Sesamum angustifolium TaxID=2727405 RepID=A0AAW2IVU9_9LAMI